MSGRRRAIVAAVVLMLAAVVLWRDRIAGFALARIVAASTGYDVSFGSLSLGISHAVARDVHVTRHGDPVLDAARVDIDYALRDIFPGGDHRFGFAAIAIDRPVLTLVRHRTGALSFSVGGRGSGPPAATRRAAAPYFFTARLRHGAIRLVDEAPLAPDLANQTIEDVAIDASVKSDARTTVRLDGVLVGRRSQTAAIARWPIHERTGIDRARGIADNRVTADALPLRGMLGFFLHTPAAEFEDGVLHGVDVHAYAVNTPPGADIDYHYGGTMTFEGGRIRIGALARPIRDLHGTLDVCEDGIALPGARGTAAGLPLVARGGLYRLFTQPQFRLALAGDGDLRALRTLFAFSAALPVTGGAHLETEVAGPVAQPLIRSRIVAPHVLYDRYAVSAMRVQADVADGIVTIGEAGGSFGAVDARVGGNVDLNGREPVLELAATAAGPGERLPYAQLIGTGSTVRLAALIDGTPSGGYTARGNVRFDGATGGDGAFAVDAKGVGEFGPFLFARADGSSLIGALRLERPISQSAAWLSARNFRIAPASALAALPGVPAPAFPALGGIVDGDVAGGGAPDDFGLAGTLRARDVSLGGRPLGNASARLDGTFTTLQLADIRVDGPLGRFAGDGVAEGEIFALRGRYDGRLEALAALGNTTGVSGALDGDVAVEVGHDRVLIQTAGASLRDADVRGVRGIEAASGTFALEGAKLDRLRVYTARATIGGNDALAAGGGSGGFLVSAPELPVANLRGTGLPLDRGDLAVFGVADLRAGVPSFDGAVLLDRGRAAGRPVSGNADVRLDDGNADVRRATVALGSTYGDLAGRVRGVGRVTPAAYDLVTHVPIADVANLRRDLALGGPMWRTLVGSFGGDLHVGGAGARPRVTGRVDVPEGGYNGLAFRDAAATIDATPTTLAARDGRVTVGTTRAAVAGSYGGGAFALQARSARADLADFNDYFDDADTLAGHGDVAFALRTGGAHTTTTGRVDLTGVRYRQLPLGATRASWSSVGGTVRGTGRIAGPAGEVTVAGTIATAPGEPLAAFRGARYDVRAAGNAVALATWLPVLGVHLPVYGALDARATVRGRYPRLALDGDASLANGIVAGYKIVSAHARTHTVGSRIALDAADADLGFGRVTADGTFGLGATDALALHAHASAADLGIALRGLSPSFALDVGGAVDVDARVAGTLAHPHLDAGFDVEHGRYATLPIPRTVGSVTLDPNHLDLHDAAVTFERGSAFIAGSLPLRLQPFGVGPGSAPLSFDVQAHAIDLAPFAPFVPGSRTRLAGLLDGRVGVEGRVEAPQLDGSVTLTGGSYVSAVESAPIRDVTARLAFEGTTVALEAFHATVGGGSLDGRGRIALPIPGASRTGYGIELTAKGDVLDFPAYGRGRVDGSLRLVSRGTLPVLSGDVTLSDARIPFAAIYRAGSGGGGAGGGTGAPFPLGFDVHATAARGVRVTAPFLDVGASGAVTLTGTLAAPQLAGAFSTTPGGIFTTYNHVFRVQSGEVTFDPAAGVVPNIDLKATAHVVNPDPDPTRNLVGSADVTVSVQGPADGFTVAYSSDPPYATDEIIALLADVSFFGPVRFGRGADAALLPGAPVPTNPLDPPGVVGSLQAATLNFNEEAFSLLNTQLTQRLIAPVERLFGGAFGLTDFQITLDYGGGVGYNARQRLGRREVYLNVGQTLSYPGRTVIGIDAQPNASSSLVFSFYEQNGVPALETALGATTASEVRTARRLKGFEPLGNRSGVTLTFTRRYP